tara:strand:+ start:2287 stop:3207 length:921 start_codon:yes stop_codon:yes gene_type:complete
MRKKNILIAGGTGFIGYHLSKKALKKKYLVSVISTKKPAKDRKLNKVKYILCDISNKNQLQKKIKSNYDFVVNLAGYVNHQEKVKTYNSHFKGSKNLADFFLNKNIISFLQIGSSTEYGRSRAPHTELTRCDIKSSYARAKFDAQKYLKKLNKRYNFKYNIIRFYQVYGPKQNLNRLIPIVVFNCLKNRSFPSSEGKQGRDFLFIDDAVDAIFKVLNNKKSINQIYNIGFGKPFNIRKLILKIVRLCMGGKPLFGKIKLRQDESLMSYPNIRKAKKKLGWKPKTDIEEGLIKTIKYYKSKKRQVDL